MKTPRQKYVQDNHYRTLVDTLRSVVEQGRFTPSEIREAAILASIMYEEVHIGPRLLLSPEMKQKFDDLYKWIDTPAPHNVPPDHDRVKVGSGS